MVRATANSVVKGLCLIAACLGGQAWAGPGPRVHVDHEHQRAAHQNHQHPEPAEAPAHHEPAAHAAQKIETPAAGAPNANGETQRKPRLSPEERRALRQQINDAAQSLYNNR